MKIDQFRGDFFCDLFFILKTSNNSFDNCLMSLSPGPTFPLGVDPFPLFKAGKGSLEAAASGAEKLRVEL